MESMARHYNGLKTTLVIEIVSENCLDIIRRVTRNFSGQGRFLKIRALQ